MRKSDVANRNEHSFFRHLACCLPRAVLGLFFAALLTSATFWAGTARAQIEAAPPTILDPGAMRAGGPAAGDAGPWLGPPPLQFQGPAPMQFQGPAPMQFQGPAQGPLISPQQPLGEMGAAVNPPPAAEAAPAPPPDYFTPRDVRNGFFQKVIVEGTYISPDLAQGFGMTDLAGRCVFALPAPSRQWPLLITPEFVSHWIVPPKGMDLPAHVYDADIEFRWLPQITDRLMLNLSATPGEYRDFTHDTGPGWRTTVDAAAIWTWTYTCKIVLGASYRDRSDENFIPIGGVLWHPNADFKADLLFPEPKVQQRVYWFTGEKENVEDWIYIAGDFGDWVWAFQHTDGQQDVLSYRDCRLLLGMERKIAGGLDWHAELGYIFARKVRTASGLSDYDPDGAVLAQIGVRY